MTREKEEKMQELQQQCLQCRRCGLCEGRHHVVFGTGNADADVMFIGEGPGEQEDLQGEPFVGRAGILLDKYLRAVDLDRKQNVYIANIIKCRPPKNRDPQPEEQERCMPWLRAQIRIIRPKLIVCLGRIAAQKLIRPDFRISSQHGSFTEKGDFLMTAILHPAALLRYPENKPGALQDFLKLQEQIRVTCPRTYEDVTIQEPPFLQKLTEKLPAGGPPQV